MADVTLHGAAQGQQMIDAVLQIQIRLDGLGVDAVGAENPQFKGNAHFQQVIA